MADSTSISLRDQAPLYVRWGPDRAPYAVELRLELVSRISAELAEAERMGIEVGGMLLGTLPNADSATLRVDEVTMIGRRFEDGAIYVLDPGQQARLAEIREAAVSHGRVGVGFFRSHLRPGPMQPSVADRTLLSEQFGQGTFVFLLVQSREPRTAAFFQATNGVLPDQPSTRKFFFDDSEFKFLPEVAGEEVETRTSDFTDPGMPDEQRYRWLAAASIAALVLLLIGGAFMGGLARLFRPASNKVNLNVTGSGKILQISWDHSAPFVTRANGANMRIEDGTGKREIHLTADELKLGEVDYEHNSPRVAVFLTLNSSEGNLGVQSIEWSGN